MTIRTCAVASAFLAAGACATPTVSFAPATSPEAVTANAGRVIDAFVLQQSRLEISNKNTAEQGKPAVFRFAVANQPEQSDRRVLILREDNWFQRTNIVLTKRPDSDLIASIGTETIDNRTALITNVGSILKGLLPVAALVAAQPEFGFQWTLAGAGDLGWKKLSPAQGIAAGWEQWGRTDPIDPKVIVSVGPVSSSAAAYPGAWFSGPMHGTYYAACREVLVTFEPKPGEPVREWRGRIADPASIEYVAFPVAGKIEMHAGCGVSVTTNKESVATPDALIATAVAQALAVKDALEKAEKK